VPHGPLLKRPFLRWPLPGLLVASLLMTAGCSVGEFLGAYFNTYYNASRAFSEAEVELLNAQDPKLADKVYLAPYVVPAGAKTKFTSVIEKCSKLLQYHPESNFVDDALMMIGKSYYYQNENQSAERKFRELIDGQPESDLVPEAKLLLANTQYRAGDREGAQATARTIVGAPEDQYQPVIRSRAALLLAAIEVDAKNFQGALEQYSTAAKYADSREDRYAALMRVAEMNLQLNNPLKAGETYSAAEGEATDYLTEYRAKLGRARMLALVGDHDEALTQLEDLLGNTNNKDMFGEIDFEIGNTYRLMDDTVRAVDHFRYVDTAYARTEFSARALYELGLLYEKKLLLYDSARVAYNKGRGVAGQAPVAALLIQRSDALNRYASLRTDIARNESLRVAILFPPDTASYGMAAHDSSAADSLAPRHGIGREDSLRLSDRTASDSTLVTPDSTLAASDSTLAASDSTLARPDSTLAAFDSTLAVSDSTVPPPDETVPPRDSAQMQAWSSAPDSVRAGADSLAQLVRTGMPDSTGADSSRAAKPRWTPVAIPLDTVESRLALGESELGALFFNALEVNDSSAYWFHRLLNDHPASPYVPRALYTLAQIARQDSLPAVADSLYTVLAERYATTEFGGTARKFLGYADLQDSSDGSDDLYRAAAELLERGKPEEAATSFSDLVRRHPASPLAGKAEYAAGWIYEQIIAVPESALVHYRAVAERYPSTPYALSVRPKLDAFDQHVREQAAAAKAVSDSIARESARLADTTAVVDTSRVTPQPVTPPEPPPDIKIEPADSTMVPELPPEVVPDTTGTEGVDTPPPGPDEKEEGGDPPPPEQSALRLPEQPPQ
jgi:TolA-binding protein